MNRQADESAGSTGVAEVRSTDASGSTFWLRVGGLALVALMTHLVWRIVAPLWQPLLWAVMFGALLSPWNQRLAKRLGDRPSIASGITTSATVLLFLLPIGFIGGAVAAQSAQLLKHLQSRVPQGSEVSTIELSTLPWLQKPLDWIAQYSNVTFEQLRGWAIKGIQNLLEILMSTGGTVVLGAMGTVVSFFLMIFVLFFVLRDGPVFAKQLVAMLPVEERRRERMWMHLSEVTRGVFMGIGLTAIVQGTLVGVGFWIAGLPSPLVFGVISIFFALVPVVGTWIIWIPGVIVLLTQGEHGHAVFLALWGALLVGSVDNFLRPILISGTAQVPTLAVFVGVMGGLAAFGFIGLFLGPIILGLLVALFRFENEELATNDAVD